MKLKTSFFAEVIPIARFQFDYVYILKLTDQDVHNRNFFVSAIPTR